MRSSTRYTKSKNISTSSCFYLVEGWADSVKDLLFPGSGIELFLEKARSQADSGGPTAASVLPSPSGSEAAIEAPC